MGRIFVCGDIHGSAINIRNIIDWIDNPKEDDFIIICGDAGFEYQDYIMGQAKKMAKKFPGNWIVLRGNHDSSYWKEHTSIINADFVANNDWEIITAFGCKYLRQKKYPNIWYLPDEGCIYRLYNYNILFIPGAYSVDKYYRLVNNYPWNPNEQLTTYEKYELYEIVSNWNKKGLPIDFVIAHTFPLKTQEYYQDLFIKNIDRSEVDSTMEEWLNYIAQIYENNYAFKQYFGGHFHDDRVVTDKYTMLYHAVENLADYEKE